MLNLYAESRSLFSNEINLISTTEGPLQWIVGAYAYQENSKQPGQVQTLDNEPLADSYLPAARCDGQRTGTGRVSSPTRTATCSTSATPACSTPTASSARRTTRSTTS